MLKQLGKKFVSATREIIAKGLVKGIALVIVLLIAGPELMVGMELMAMVEMLGASTFVLAYWAGLKLLIGKPYKMLVKFEQSSCFFIPTAKSLKEMPQLAFHVIPERLSMLSYLFFVTAFGLSFFVLA